jgi:hypothetical protein
MRVGVALRAVVLAMLLAACATASPSEPASPSGDGSLAPAAPAEILFRLAHHWDTGDITPDLTLYDDGRLLTRDPDDGALYLRVMNQRGMDALLGEVAGSGWFDRSHEVLVELMPGMDPGPSHGVSSDEFILRNDDGALISVLNVMPDAGPPVYAPSEERAALNELAERIRSLSRLPTDGWLMGDPQPFRATAFLLISGLYELDPPGPCPSDSRDPRCAFDVDRIDWPVAPPAAGYGSGFVSADGLHTEPWDHCLLIGRPLAEAFAKAVDETGSQSVDVLYGFGESYPWSTRRGWFDLWLRPLLPEEPATCAGKNAPVVAFH